MCAAVPGTSGVGLVRAVDRYTWYASLARLAPSKHNTQPWRFGITGAALDVWADPSRRLPASDPLGRELVVACGAAVQGAVVAATALGVELSVEPWPDGPTGPVARLTETGRTSPSEQDLLLLDAVRARRTDRGPLDGRALPASLPFLLRDAAEQHGCALRLVRNEGDQRALARLIELADRQLARSPEVEEELRAWLRPPQDERADGVPARASRGSQASYTAPYVQRDFSLPDVEHAHERDGVDDPLVAVLCTPADAPLNWLQGGRALMSVLLTATAGGAGASYLNQPLEVPALRDVLTRDLDLVGHPQAVLRIGLGARVPVPPRRPLPQLRLHP